MLGTSFEERREWARRAYAMFRHLRHVDAGHLLPEWDDLDEQARAAHQAAAIAAVKAATERNVGGLHMSGAARLRAAEALADAVQLMIDRKQINPRSFAGDALLDFRNPPQRPGSDALATAVGLLERIMEEPLRQPLFDDVEAFLGKLKRPSDVAIVERILQADGLASDHSGL